MVRNLVLAAVASFLPALAAAAALWTGVMRIPLGGLDVRLVLVPMGVSIGLTCAALAVYKVWGGKVGKLHKRERLLDSLSWRGDERVLDVGSEPGKRVTRKRR